MGVKRIRTRSGTLPLLGDEHVVPPAPLDPHARRLDRPAAGPPRPVALARHRAVREQPCRRGLGEAIVDRPGIAVAHHLGRDRPLDARC